MSNGVGATLKDLEYWYAIFSLEFKGGFSVSVRGDHHHQKPLIDNLFLFMIHSIWSLETVFQCILSFVKSGHLSFVRRDQKE